MDSPSQSDQGPRRRARKTRNLGVNRSRDAPKIYDYIEKHFGPTKYCGRGKRGTGSRFGLKHEGPNPVPIREFSLNNNAHLDPKGNVVIESGDGLQGACIRCDRAYRRARLTMYREKYSGMTASQVYANYRREYGELMRCSRCNLNKKPEEFSISIGMERGLHNVCKDCADSYSESVGERWAKFSPDGHHVIDITAEDSCLKCGSAKRLHKDHIWPLSKGGTDNEENIQVLCGDHNLSKSDTIDTSLIKSLDDIEHEMICKRYWSLLKKAKSEGWSVHRFDIEISKAAREFIVWKSRLGDKELRLFFIEEKIRNNRKHNVDHAVKKFREYCENTILDSTAYVESGGQ